MNTIKIGGRTWLIEFDDNTESVGKQITEMLNHTRLRQIESVMRDLPAYVSFKHNAVLTTAQCYRLWNTLTEMRLQNVTTAIYQWAVTTARSKPFTCMSSEPFYTEIDRAIQMELNSPQLLLPLDAAGEAHAPASYPGSFHGEEYTAAELLQAPANLSQLALPLVTD
jgi:hypothetical protein